MNHYETVFILTPVLSDSQVEEAVRKFEDLLKEHNCEIVAKENWGLKKLAYPIRKMNEGFYIVVEFKAEAELPKELDRRLRIADACIRHMIINKDEK